MCYLFPTIHMGVPLSVLIHLFIESVSKGIPHPEWDFRVGPNGLSGNNVLNGHNVLRTHTVLSRQVAFSAHCTFSSGVAFSKGPHRIGSVGEIPKIFLRMM